MELKVASKLTTPGVLAWFLPTTTLSVLPIESATSDCQRKEKSIDQKKVNPIFT